MYELSEADGSLSVVNGRDEILGWAAAEFLLSLPTLSGLLVVALAGVAPVTEVFVGEYLRGQPLYGHHHPGDGHSSAVRSFPRLSISTNGTRGCVAKAAIST
jgi:hypothetical protein